MNFNYLQHILSYIRHRKLPNLTIQAPCEWQKSSSVAIPDPLPAFLGKSAGIKRPSPSILALNTGLPEAAVKMVHER